MSFFGFDPSSNPQERSQVADYDFSETYDGLGGRSKESREVEDQLNQIGQGSVSAVDINEPLQPIPSLWGHPSPAVPSPLQSNTPVTKKVLSLEEIEAQLLGGQLSQQTHQQAQQAPDPRYFNQFVPMPGQFGFPPGPNGPPGFNGQQFPFMQPPMGAPNNQQFMMPQYFNGELPPPQVQQQQPQAQPQAQPQVQQQQIQQQTQQIQQIQQQSQTSTPQPQPLPIQSQVSPQRNLPKIESLNQFPPLGSTPPKHLELSPSQLNQLSQLDQHIQTSPARGAFQQHPIQNQNIPGGPRQFYRDQNRSNHYHHQHQSEKELTPSERDRLIRRSEKVQRIVKYNGLMNARDKDFVSRVQLSQIITDDPYNEDFYYQVHKAIETGVTGVGPQDLNLFAETYLNQSGHRLGGRYKRADLALQRMQQQVQKAVLVAKDHPKQYQFSREGSLGKVTVSSGKAPRKSLEIKKIYNPNKNNESKKDKQHKLIYLLKNLEKIYSILLNLESFDRERSTTTTTNNEEDNEKLSILESNLWDSLLIFQPIEYGDIHPLIAMIAHDKGKKIIPRVFRFLNREQKLTLITLLVANLSKLDVVFNGSYLKYENGILPIEIEKSIELFMRTSLPPFVMFISESTTFREIVGLIDILMDRNEVVLSSTSKAGLSLLTFLISRTEIIKQETIINNDDKLEWEQTYDKLFSHFKGHLSSIFPPIPIQSPNPDPTESNTNSNSNSKSKNDDSYSWQFLASLALASKLSHQRIMVDEVRDRIFTTMNEAKTLSESLKDEDHELSVLKINNLNLFLNVIGLNANTTEITELETVTVN